MDPPVPALFHPLPPNQQRTLRQRESGNEAIVSEVLRFNGDRVADLWTAAFRPFSLY
jgi:hypothetical protein